jgi:hypothetical protein
MPDPSAVHPAQRAIAHHQVLAIADLHRALARIRSVHDSGAPSVLLPAPQG